MIVETIVTTLAADGGVNFAPMGVDWGEDELVIRPYVDTTTFANLVACGQAVVNLTDDVLCFAMGAICSPRFPAIPAEHVRGMVLEDACSWREVEVLDADTMPPRARFTCRVVHRGVRREFVGFNRARNAVLEAAILASRTKLLPMREILAQLERLQRPVEKTGGPREREAMALLVGYVRRRAASPREPAATGETAP